MSKPAPLGSARRYGPTQVAGEGLLGSLEALLEPLVLVGTLWAVTAFFHRELSGAYLILSMVVFALTFPGISRLGAPVWKMIVQVVLSWIWIAGLLLLGGYASRSLHHFSAPILQILLWAAPLGLVAAHLSVRVLAPSILALQGPRQPVVIVGMNAQGLALANSIEKAEYSHTVLKGFFDDRDGQRLQDPGRHALLGRIDELSAYVKAHRVSVVYLSLPMAAEPRVLQILDALKDTTGSIYFVPDMFVTDLIQGRTASVNGVPVISVCETPFHGVMGLVKRGSDIFLSMAILLLIAPVLMVIAVAVKLSSPGPVIFQQRRYGLDGQEIVVYKFRSMQVAEDGEQIRQAQKNDSRTTPLGALLRRTSLDELPQFVNVLQGRMSIVGPRPHAVAHNESYRKLIKGYMVRHKVKPGITGWAQINGFRGETETLDKMQGRIDYDLDYLRNWSLQLDLHIIFRTIKLVFSDQRAY